MALSSVANSSVTQNSVNLKTSQSENKQTDKARLSISPGNSTETLASIGDNVALSKAAEASASRDIGQNGDIQIENLLPRTLLSIVENSDTAIAAQANITADSAKEMLA